MKEHIQFTIDDYNEYISHNITINDLSAKYNRSRNQINYQFQKFMAENNLPNKRKKAQTDRNDEYFDKIDTCNKAYILGFYLADGCCSNNVLTFVQTESDGDILNEIRNEIYPSCSINTIKEHKVKKTGYVSKPCKSLHMHSIHLCETLRKYFGERKTYVEHTVKDIVPEEFIFDFIRGYFDGDGCISFSYMTRKKILKNGSEATFHNINKQWFIVSHTKNILDEIQEYLKSYGIITHVFQEQRGNYIINTSSYQEIKKIYENMYYDGCICMKRKKDKFEDLIREMSK